MPTTFVIFETASGGITGKYSVADSSDVANYSNTLIVSANSMANVEFANKVSSGGVSLLSKIVTSITVAASIFLGNGTAVCSMKISPVSNSCWVDISNFSSQFSVSSSDPHILLTSTASSQFQVQIHGDINHYATPITVAAT